MADSPYRVQVDELVGKIRDAEADVKALRADIKAFRATLDSDFLHLLKFTTGAALFLTLCVLTVRVGWLWSAAKWPDPPAQVPQTTTNPKVLEQK